MEWVVPSYTTDTNTQLSNAEVRTAVEAATDSNVFTDADHTKLNGIEASATADQTASDIVALVADQTIAPSEIDMEDSEKIKLGTSDDLEIYHDGSNSRIAESGTGKLILTSNGDGVLIQDHSSGSNMAKFLNGGAVELYHNYSKKFETASAGSAFTGGVSGNLSAVSSATTITLDMATACHFTVTLAHNTTFADPSNEVAGQSGSIIITQDGTGSRTAAFNSAFKFVGGTAPTLSTAAGAVDRIDYLVVAAGNIHAVVSLDVK